MKEKISIRSTEETFKILSQKLKDEKRLIFSRFGDVDFMMMKKDCIGKTIGRSNKMFVSENLHKEIIESFSVDDENYLIGHFSNMKFEPGMDILDLPGNYKPGTPQFKQWHEKCQEMTYDIINEQNIKFKNLKFYNHSTFIIYSIFKEQQLKEFIAENIAPKKKMFIGCRERNLVEGIFGKLDYYIKTPEYNSYSKIDDWWPDVEKNIKNVDLVLPFSGQAGRVVNKRLWKMGCQVQSIDMGSWIDPFVGVTNRTWTRLAINHIRKNRMNI